ncbi:MazG nucleotide pyrophosphohydrolase domain-containing protein [Blastococcus brunescens]|uniref:MazG nucleotide pyrophosphohydrolase domain-containing protein n=1 Tax=Blastococcus brunescens TaxID=1564165 RepID=A0ABZ1B1P4_9ACTN|nr:MazG nucleotide pyrophosphohydrolase domain-containing protein [Blastococcus sp. BMG 8361]WRL64732.1 MazG nucleotide pyrophosphohydrolase domain-containing protein [Blastococcus sp. BMG 8361]
MLDLLVQEEVYAAAAERFDVQVSDRDVRARIDELLGDDDPDEVFAQLAQQGIGRADVIENVRQQLVRREIAEAEGGAGALGEEALRARYEEVRESLAQVSFGYITVPDEATAQTVVAQLTADPAAYPAVAAQYAGAATIPALESRAPEELPGILAEGIAAAAPNTAFATPVPEAGGVVVTFVEGTVYPTFEEVRPQLEEEAAEVVEAAGNERIEAVREDLGVTVNPRYGPLDGGVVDILGDEDTALTPPPPSSRSGPVAETDRVPVVSVVPVSPHLPGLLGTAGWRAVTSGRPVVALPGAGASAAELRRHGVDVADVGAEAARDRPDDVVCLVTPEEVHLFPGAPAVARPVGAGLLDVVAVMDRLRSPGGCPWDAEQTHSSLRGYLLEEAHEAYDAIVDDDPAAMREELGDVLLQVAFHARVAAEAGAERRFDIDDVAGDLVAKLVRRHPHVFGDAGPRDVAAVEAGWEEIKKAEKQRTSPTEGSRGPSPRPRGERRSCGGPGVRGCARRSPRTSPTTAPRRWGASARRRHGRRAAWLGRRGRAPRGGPPVRGELDAEAAASSTGHPS